MKANTLVIYKKGCWLDMSTRHHLMQGLTAAWAWLRVSREGGGQEDKGAYKGAPGITAWVDQMQTGGGPRRHKEDENSDGGLPW